MTQEFIKKQIDRLISMGFDPQWTENAESILELVHHQGWMDGMAKSSEIIDKVNEEKSNL